jgi:hypothetical protein
MTAQQGHLTMVFRDKSPGFITEPFEISLQCSLHKELGVKIQVPRSCYLPGLV